MLKTEGKFLALNTMHVEMAIRVPEILGTGEGESGGTGRGRVAGVEGGWDMICFDMLRGVSVVI